MAANELSDGAFPLQPTSRAVAVGETLLVVELEDLIGKQTVTYELPVVVHPTRPVAPAGKR